MPRYANTVNLHEILSRKTQVDRTVNMPTTYPLNRKRAHLQDRLEGILQGGERWGWGGVGSVVGRRSFSL